MQLHKPISLPHPPNKLHDNRSEEKRADQFSNDVRKEVKQEEKEEKKKEKEPN
jgi:hypothetical protein